MDISKIKPTAKVTYEVGLQSVTLEVRFVGRDEAVDFVEMDEQGKTRMIEMRRSEANRKLIYSAVVGWDLMDGEASLPCTPENKEKYLPFVLGRKDAAGNVIGWELLGFILDPDNFLKN